MTQNFIDDVFKVTDIIDDTMNAMEGNFKALRSNFSGANAPVNILLGQLWHRPGASSECLHVLNSNNVWMNIFLGDEEHQMYFYRNDSCIGWELVTGVEDAVLAVKGGSDVYNVDGGDVAGTWTVPDHTHDPGTYQISHTHTGDRLTLEGTPPSTTTAIDAVYNTVTVLEGISESVALVSSTWRPAAGVGTLQKPSTAS